MNLFFLFSLLRKFSLIKYNIFRALKQNFMKIKKICRTYIFLFSFIDLFIYSFFYVFILFFFRKMTYLYKIVLFEDDKAETFSVDVVPTNWIFISEELNSKACHFPVGFHSVHHKFLICIRRLKTANLLRIHGRYIE